MGGRRGWHVCIVTWKHALPCVKWTANGNLLHDSGNSEALYQPRGVTRDGEGDGKEGTYVYLWLTHAEV